MYYSISIPNGLLFDTFLSLIFVVISSRSCIGGGLKEKTKVLPHLYQMKMRILKVGKKLEILVCEESIEVF